jgi:hypothetical protein
MASRHGGPGRRPPIRPPPHVLASFGEAIAQLGHSLQRAIDTFTSREPPDTPSAQEVAAATRLQAVARGAATRHAYRELLASSDKSMNEALPLMIEHPTLMQYQFPVYVLPIHRLLKLEAMRTHEALLEEGQLVQWQPGMGPMIFVSQ